MVTKIQADIVPGRGVVGGLDSSIDLQGIGGVVIDFIDHIVSSRARVTTVTGKITVVTEIQRARGNR